LSPKSEMKTDGNHGKMMIEGHKGWCGMGWSVDCKISLVIYSHEFPAKLLRLIELVELNEEFDKSNAHQQ
jgi:hypothetical protein